MKSIYTVRGKFLCKYWREGIWEQFKSTIYPQFTSTSNGNQFFTEKSEQQTEQYFLQIYLMGCHQGSFIVFSEASIFRDSKM